MDHCYLKFKVADDKRFTALERVVGELIIEGTSESKRSEDEWKSFFDESAFKSFWWPSDEERKEWEKVWFRTPYQERHKILPTRWDFGSMIETIISNEWLLVGIRKLSTNEAIIEFDPQAYPFGGTNCLVALAESFGHQVIERDDGTGVEQYQTVKQYWQPSTKKHSWWQIW
jgi:hypothetical protein